MRYPTTQQEHAYMKMRQNQNIEQCKASKAEAWVLERLSKETPLKWKRQSQWGYRLFDFWNAEYGIAVEVDGKEHNQVYDAVRDQYNFNRSGIIVIRIRNFDEVDAEIAINLIATIVARKETWLARREQMNLLTKSQKKLVDKRRANACQSNDKRAVSS